jgi:hypothetical protein
MSHEHDNGVCQPDCMYRKLYEGSQTSLNDMSARQSASLSRVGRLRAGIVTTIRRSFPEIAEKAEREMGRRLAEVDDEVLLTFIDNLTASAIRQEERTALLALGTALQSAGYPIILTENPSKWVAAVRAGNPDRKAQPSVAPATNEQPTACRHDTSAETTTAATTRTPPARKAPTASDEVRNISTVTNGFDSRGPETGASGSSTNLDASRPLADLLADVEWPEDVIPVPAQTVISIAAGEGGDQPSFVNPSESSSHTESASLADLFGSELWSGELGDPSDTAEGWSPSPIKVTSEPVKRPSAPAAMPPPVTHNASTQTPLRPELFPSQPKTKGAKKGRAVRVTAEPAYPYASDDAPAVLDENLRQALLAASAIPRPVFTRDLVSIAGSPELVDTWEDECRATPETNPVRFIAPKQRHKLRGSLVVPDDSIRAGKHREDDWWNRCIELYRAARLYEMGVLLHRVGDELVSAKFTQHHALLRLNSTRGLVGIVVSADDRIEQGEQAREELAAAMSELMRERLTLVAVLTSAGEERELERLIATVLELSRERGWDPSFPVVAARSWEYADDRGSTSRLVIGG